MVLQYSLVRTHPTPIVLQQQQRCKNSVNTLHSLPPHIGNSIHHHHHHHQNHTHALKPRSYATLICYPLTSGVQQQRLLVPLFQLSSTMMVVMLLLLSYTGSSIPHHHIAVSLASSSCIPIPPTSTCHLLYSWRCCCGICCCTVECLQHLHHC